MIRKIIHIDQEKCNGCGACARACHEGAIGMENGKAVLLRDDYCDGLGDCLPTCPTGAISFVEREAAAYDEAAVAQHMQHKQVPAGCPGQRMHQMAPAAPANQPMRASCLGQWPVQIKLVPVNAPFFAGADVLVAADCTAFAYARMHQEFMHNRVTLIGCPKLDAVDYSEKLTAILQANKIASLTVVRMEVPCCGGLANAVQRALLASGQTVPCRVVTISIDGRVLEN
ncbi:4Fe-4S binding protein [uncultured Gemmiger sp.]|uniref:ATP-binding protein n=1 Tax=uncultured Gemmiger sp. TaxID=1623490 RepID=UPI0025CF5F7A|nr:4Fe-4S binding protein [uncultured Gemmiger sp.]